MHFLQTLLKHRYQDLSPVEYARLTKVSLHKQDTLTWLVYNWVIYLFNLSIKSKKDWNHSDWLKNNVIGLERFNFIMLWYYSWILGSNKQVNKLRSTPQNTAPLWLQNYPSWFYFGNGSSPSISQSGSRSWSDHTLYYLRMSLDINKSLRQDVMSRSLLL